MRVPRRVLAVVAAAIAVAAAGCGKKGNPLPPLRPIPARIADLTAIRTPGVVELRFTVPAANLDGTIPVAIDRIDVYGVGAEADQPPLVAQVAGQPANLLGSIIVGSPAAGADAEPAEVVRPRPGSAATYLHRTTDLEQGGAAVVVYTLVPVAGGGRGRPGPPTALVTVPLGPLPPAPGAVTIDHDESTVRVNWKSPADGLVFRVFTDGSAPDAPPALLTPEPLDGPPFTAPVEFGREMCVTVRASAVTGPVALAGPSSARVCATPEDRYAPPAPASLRVVQEGAAVVLVWDPVEAADLSGYVVLRGDGANATLTPLMREPIPDVAYRDTTVVPGATYSYAVYAVDTSPAANVGPTSERQMLTVR